MTNKSRLEKLEKKHIVSSAVVIVRKGETEKEARKRYEKVNKMKLSECSSITIIFDNI